MAQRNDVRARQTYVPLSRGMDDHLRKLSGNALKVFLHLLINASYCGPMKGICKSSLDRSRPISGCTTRPFVGRSKNSKVTT